MAKLGKKRALPPKANVKRFIEDDSDSDEEDSFVAKKKRVSWAEKLESYQGEELEVEKKPKANGSAKAAPPLPNDTVEDVEMVSEDGDDEEETGSETGSETPEAESDEEDKTVSEDEGDSAAESPKQPATNGISMSGDSAPSKKTAEKAKKAYTKFDYTTAMERTVFVGNVPYHVKAASLKKLFRPYGKIDAIYKRSILQKTEKLTKKMFGTDDKLKDNVTEAHVYVRYEKEEDAKKAVELNGTLFNGRNLRVTISSDTKVDASRTMFVGNLPYKIAEQALLEFFNEKIGEVESVRVARDKTTGLGRGYAFVTFKSADKFAKALDNLEGVRFKGREIRVKKMFKKKKNKPVSGLADAKQKAKQAKKQRNDNRIQQKLANYVVTKKHVGNSASDKLSKKTLKSIKKRKQGKVKKSLLS